MADGRARGRVLLFLLRGCYEASTTDDKGVTCDACSKRFVVELVSQVIATKGVRHYACTPDCREQLVREASGVRLGGSSTPAAPTMTATARRPGSARERRDAIRSHAESRARGSWRRVPASARGVQPQGRHRQDDDRGQRRRGARGARASGCSSSTPTRKATSACRSARRRSARSTTCSSWGSASPTPPRRCARTSICLPSNETLAAAELYLAGRQNRDRVLAERLASAAQRLRLRHPRLLAEPLAHEPERARLRRQRARAGRVRLPLARRRAAGASRR